MSLHDDALSRIAADIVYKDDALKVLYWVSLARRPLTIDELTHALAVEPEELKYDKDNELLDGITSICAGLVVINYNSRLVRLAHHTTDEYLKRTQGRHLPDVSLHIASVLLTYLSIDVFKGSALARGVDPYETLQQHPLLECATIYWGHHFLASERISAAVRSRALGFLQLTNRYSDFFIEKIIASHITKGTSGVVSGLHIAVIIDLQEFVSALQALERERNVKSPFLISPLRLTAVLGREQAALLLIEGGADVDEVPGDPCRPLHRAAAASRSHEICRLLIKYGADINIKFAANPEDSVPHLRTEHLTPLHEAVYYRNTEIVALLLDNGADAYAEITAGRRHLERFKAPILRSKSLWPPLVSSGSKDNLNDMIQKGLDINERGHRGMRALDMALELGNEDIVSTLLATGAFPSMVWKHSQPQISRFLHTPWYDRLSQRLAEHQTDWHSVTKGSHASDEQSWEPLLVINDSSVIEPHIELTVPDDIVRPIQTIVIKTVSHDQGWSDFTIDHGTYVGSWLFLEARLRNPDERKNLELGSPKKYQCGLGIQHNVHASSHWRTHTNIYNREDLPLSELEFLDSIELGSTIEILARAVFRGWENHVSFIKVDVYGS